MEIQCPACGAEGRAPKDKIRTRLVCRKCLKVFHITSSGKTVLGEPLPTGQPSIAGSQEAIAADSTQRVDQWFERTSKQLFSPSSLIFCLGFILLSLAIAFFATRRQESLQERVAKAAKAAVLGDLQSIRELAATATEDGLVMWYISVRPQCDQLLQRSGGKTLAVETEVIRQDPDQERAEVVAHVSIEESLERKGVSLPEASMSITPGLLISLPLAWKREGSAGWRLDGSRTQELTKP